MFIINDPIFKTIDKVAKIILQDERCKIKFHPEKNIILFEIPYFIKLYASTSSKEIDATAALPVKKAIFPLGKTLTNLLIGNTKRNFIFFAIETYCEEENIWDPENISDISRSLIQKNSFWGWVNLKKNN